MNSHTPSDTVNNFYSQMKKHESPVRFDITLLLIIAVDDFEDNLSYVCCDCRVL